MIVEYSFMIFMFVLTVTQGIPYKVQTIEDDPPEPLSMDQAYLTVRNSYSIQVVLLGNKIICEGCDLEQMIVADSNDSDTEVIDTKYAYDLELWPQPSNGPSLCTFASYKFAEHGTYIFDIVQITPDTVHCSIKQVGKLSYYLTPAIVGIVFVVLYVVVVQLLHHMYYGRYSNYFRTKILRQGSINDNIETTSQVSRRGLLPETVNDADENIIRTTAGISKMPLTAATHLLSNMPRAASKRLRALDTFRGFSLMVMIFVNYGGGGYWFFDHSIWNGLTLADLVFPWFTWLMGVSIVLSQRSLRSKNVSKLSILLKICRRTIILFVLGLTGNDGLAKLKELRIPGVLQRLAICYCLTAILVLIFDKKDHERNTIQSPIGSDEERPLRIELFHTVLQFWIQWLCVMLVITVWIFIIFLLPVPNCPTGYLGPGGKHDHGKHWNCTGGAAGHIDLVVLGNTHLYDGPTCKEIYETTVNYDPEGIMGNLTGVLLCYLGVQAGHIFIHSTCVRRICTQWFVWGVICGSLGLGLSYGGHSDSFIPINKNLWSLTFVLCLASLAYLILPVLYLLVDVHQWFTGAPFLWLGMNSIAIYIGHERFGTSFPVQFAANNTHAAQLAMHLYGSFFWSVVAGVMYYKKVFIAI